MSICVYLTGPPPTMILITVRFSKNPFIIIHREGSSHILLVPELGVSKTHAQMLYDTERRCYTITDLGSQNGTVLNGVPLTRKVRESKTLDIKWIKTVVKINTRTVVIVS